MRVRRFADRGALTAATADELAALIEQAIAARGRCHLALSGGTTPRAVYERLATLPVAWDRVELWWGDERCVPPDDADSNFRMAREALLDRLAADAISIAGVHRIHAELDPVAAAGAYERDLVHALGVPPALDVVLLGLGPDGHTASLFPDTPALAETTRWVVANPVAQLATTRITMTARALVAARVIRFLVAGADKAEAMAAVLEGPPAPARYPAQLVATAATDVAWLVDDAAAGKLARAA